MINKNELRIGSLMYAATDEDENGKEYQIMCKVLQMFNDVCHWTNDLKQASIMEGYSATDYDYCDPISITPDVLKMCGFIKDEFEEEVNGYEKYKSDTNFHFDIFLNNKNHCCVHYLGVAFANHPQSLHLLQNAVLALTGEELNVEV
jgi:hypothetical protein